VGCVEHARLPVDLEAGNRLEKGDHRFFRLFVALDSGGLKGGADLRMAKVVWLSASAGVVATGTKDVVMERSGDLSVREVEGFGRGDGVEGEPAEKGSVLEHRFLMMRGKAGEEGGVSFFEEFGASSSLAGEGSVVIFEREVEEGSKEALRGLDCDRSRVRSDLVKGEDAEPSEASGEGDDLGVGVEGAGRGAEKEEGMLKLSVDLFPAVRQVVRLETTLKVASTRRSTRRETFSTSITQDN
jgi:hypothetical protein